VEQITIILDGIEASGHPETTILQLAEEMGIAIPSMCYDSHLTPLGACRVCLVEDENSGRLLASCVTPIAAGMNINTKSARVLETRRNVVELMLASHPDSCIVCDEGNRCKLRQIATDLGIGLVSFEKIPIYHEVVDLNPFIRRDLSKCVKCGRCIRADQDIAVVGAIDYTDRGFESRPATFCDAPLEKTECNFCGICVSMCPTGALSASSRVSTLTGDRATRTTCPLCAAGCQILLEHRQGRVLGVSPAKDDRSVNHVSLCVKGHYGMDFINSEGRLTTPLIRKNGELTAAAWDEALELVASRFDEIKKNKGPGALGAIGASSCTNEENYLLQKLVRVGWGCNNVDSGARLRGCALSAGIAEVLGAGEMTNPISHIRDADEILVIGADPLNENPIAGQLIKQAVKLSGARLTLVNSIDQGLTAFADARLCLRPGAHNAFLAGLIREIMDVCKLPRESNDDDVAWFAKMREKVEVFTPEKVEEATGIPAKLVKKTAERLGNAKSLAIIFGADLACEKGARLSGVLLATLARLTGHIGKAGCGLFPLASSLNDQGALDMGAQPGKLPGWHDVDDSEVREAFGKIWDTALPEKNGLDYLSMIEAARAGDLAGLYVVGENPVSDCPGGQEVKIALSKLDFLVVQDRFLTETASLADVVLPSATFAEKDGSMTSVERRIQLVRKAFEPPGQARPDWEILLDLMRRLGLESSIKNPVDIFSEINKAVAMYRGATLKNLRRESVFWPCVSPDEPGVEVLYTDSPPRICVDEPPDLPAPTAPEYSQARPFSLILTQSLFQSADGASAYSKTLTKLNEAVRVSMNPVDAAPRGIADGGMALIASGSLKVRTTVALSEDTPRGILVAESGSFKAFGSLFTLADRDREHGAPCFYRVAVSVEATDV
jgi:formate dehydrogenase (NADP+) alpha subunit